MTPSPLSMAMMMAAGALAITPPGHASTPSIRWNACPSELISENTSLVLGDRLRCARVRMPLDHLAASSPSIDVGVVRIAAMGTRKGAVFVNVGGPGGQPADYVASMAAAFGWVDPNDPVHGNKHRLVQDYDLVAVIPRGLVGGSTYECDAPADTHAFLPTHRDDANWQRAMDDAQARVTACTQAPEALYISTAQHVHDMDAVRRALGDERIHFYGISYGSRVGATYAALYPDHLGRMLLDSPMYFLGPNSYRTAMYLTGDAQQRLFDEQVLAPVLREPQRYGQSPDRQALEWATRDISPELRPAWHNALTTPARLAAALSMDRWIKAGGWHGWGALGMRASTASFSTDAEVDRQMREAANELVQLGNDASDETRRRPSTPHHPIIDIHGEWTNLAVMCNDESWQKPEWKIRSYLDRDAFSYPQFGGDHIMEQLTCSRWPRRQTIDPDLSSLNTHEPFLIIQASNDPITPLSGARTMLRKISSARLLVATGAHRHGLLGQSATPCVEEGALAYLLDGRLPGGDGRETSCDFVPVTSENNPYNLADYPDYGDDDTDDASLELSL